MYKKIKHYIRRYLYRRNNRMFPELKNVSNSVAACGQDVFIAELLSFKKNGVFVDIGANDGVTISNTWYFEKELGWGGVAIEPIPRIYEQLKQNRKCKLFEGCITPKSGIQKFVELSGATSMLSTLEQNISGLTSRRISKNIARQNTTKKSIDVVCTTLANLLEEHGIEEIDFLSIDTEGGELEIIKSINFEQFPVKVISVENNLFTNNIKNYLENEGFVYLGTFKIDEIYIYGGDILRRSTVV